MTIYLKGRQHEVTGQRGSRWYATLCGEEIFHTDNNNTYLHEDGVATCPACLRVRARRSDG